MTRVLFVDHETRLSGGERDLVDLIAGFGPDRIDAHVAVPADGELATALRDLGATVHIVPMSARLQKVSRWELARNPLRAGRHAASAARWAGRLRHLARRLHPDLVHTNSMKAHVLAVPAGRAVRVPMIWHVRDILEASWLRRAFNGAASLFAARVICLSDAAAAPFRGSRIERRVRVVYNGVRPRPVTADETATARARLGVDGDQPLIGIVGQIARWKGQDVFLDAAAKVRAAHPDARFAIVGTCLFPENEAAFEAGLHEEAETLGLRDDVAWPGHVEPIDDVMAALDVLVHASRLPEPFGRVMIEAMAQGTPVVTTTLGAGPELVPPDAGRLVTPDDAGALASALTSLLDDRAALARASEAARRHAASFTAEATASGVLAVYDEVLDRIDAP